MQVKDDLLELKTIDFMKISKIILPTWAMSVQTLFLKNLDLILK